MGIEASLDDEEPAVDDTPFDSSAADSISNTGNKKRSPTLKEFMRTVDELKGRIPLHFTAAIYLYTTIRVLHPGESIEWAIEETYSRMPESKPENIAKYKPNYKYHSL